MKKSLFLLTAFLSLFITNTKAQDDPNCGFVVDGVLVDSITSWSIGDLKVVFPILQSWKKFDFIEGIIYFDGTTESRGQYTRSRKIAKYYFRLKPEDLDAYSDAKYAIWTIIKKENEDRKKAIASDGYCTDCKAGGDYSTMPVDENDKPIKPVIFMELRGHTITGNQASYGNSSAVKVPVYDGNPNGVLDDTRNDRQTLLAPIHYSGEILYTSNQIPCKLCFCSYDKKAFKKITAVNECDQCKIDYSKQSVQPGKKFILKIEQVDVKGEFGKIKTK